jgi:photosystem II stability/assembly factor-like uncharacterized protein
MQTFRVRFSVRILAAALLALLPVSGAQAGQNRWTPVGLGGGLVFSLAVDPDVPGVVYAAATVGGIYRSTDAARTWQWRGVPVPAFDAWTAVIVAPGDAQRLYATTQPFQSAAGLLYTSGDGGAHWQELFSRPAGFNAVAASPDGTLLVAGKDAEVHRSVDGGQTWSLVLDAEEGSFHTLQIGFDPLAPQIAYAGAPGGLWRSTDGGATWAKTGTGPGGQPLEQVSALAFPGTAPGFLYAVAENRLFRSEDGGLTWSGGALLAAGGQGLAVDPRDPRTVYVAGFIVSVSHDGGDTVSALPQPDTGVYTGRLAVALSPAAPDTLYLAVTSVGVIVSPDAGEHWTLSEQRGLSALLVSRGDFLAAPSGRLYQEPFDGLGLFRSLDRGATWSPLAPLPGPLFELAEEAGAPQHLWAASNPLFHSADGGASWTPVRLSTTSTQVASPAPRVILAGGCGLQRSADGGRTWKKQFTCAPAQGKVDIITKLGVPPGWPGAVWAEIESRRSGQSTRKVLLSRDSGKTWRTLAESTSFSTLLRAAAARRVIYLQRGETLQRSNDAGASWTTLAVPVPFSAVAVDAVNPEIVYLATLTRGVLRSTNGGRAWSEANAGLAALGRLWVFDIAADPKLPGTAYAFPVQGAIFQARFGNP